MPAVDFPDSDPAAFMAAVDGAARKTQTSCGDGAMVWRVWGAGEPLVLFHGGSGSWTHWIQTIAVLSQHYELWVPDIPGLGESTMPPEPRTPSTIADVAAAGLRTLLPDGPKLRIAGFSFGGHVAGLTTLRLQERVRNLTLIGVAALGLRAQPREPFAKVRIGMTAEQRDAVYRQNLAVLMFADEANIDPLAIHLQARNIGQARFRSRPFAATDHLAAALAGIKVPLRTIWGTRDTIARPSLDARLDILRRHHPELQVRLIEGAGHWAMYEAADRFNAAFLELLASD